MDELTGQIIYIDRRPLIRPYTDEDEDTLRDYRPNQVVRQKIYGIQKQRSVPQLRLWWASCRFLSENTEDRNWNTRRKVSDHVLANLGEFDTKRAIVLPDGTVYMPLKSISFKTLKHLEACNIFNRGYEEMASKMGVEAKGKHPDGTPKTAGDCFVEKVKQDMSERNGGY